MSRHKFIPVNTPAFLGNEKKYLSECIDTGWVSSEGPFVEKFEHLFSAKVNKKYGIAVSNGSVAIDAAIESLNLKPGDEIILPAFTIISCIAQIVRSGIIPVLVDSDPKTLNMNVTEIESKITSNTKAIMVVHIYGLPVDMDSISAIVNKHKLILIEDAAEMHGQTFKGLPCGSFGDISTFSFYSNKHITTGEGGMILTNSQEYAESCKSLRNLCFEIDNRFVHKRLGWNLRMTNLQAAVGVAQIERLDEIVIKKRYIGKKYNQLLKNLPMVTLPLEKIEGAENIYWVYSLILDENFPFDAKFVISYLQEKGIGSRPFFCPMHMQPILKSKNLFINQSFPVAESLYMRGFYIPSGLGLTDSDLERVAEVLWGFFKGFS